MPLLTSFLLSLGILAGAFSPMASEPQEPAQLFDTDLSGGQLVYDIEDPFLDPFYHYVYQFSGPEADAFEADLESSPIWQPLPPYVDVLPYGAYLDIDGGRQYGPFVPRSMAGEPVAIPPRPERGYYAYQNHDPEDHPLQPWEQETLAFETEHFGGPISSNYSLAIYDADTDRLYYYEFHI